MAFKEMHKLVEGLNNKLARINSANGSLAIVHSARLTQGIGACIYTTSNGLKLADIKQRVQRTKFELLVQKH